MVAPHIIRSPAALGINEAMREELVDFGSANLRSENVRRFQDGEAGVRYGYTALANGLIDATNPTAGYKLLADRQTTMRICDGTAQVYDAKSATWKSIGRAPDCSVAEIDLPSLGTVCTVEDQEQCNGYVAVAYRVIGALGTSYVFTTVVNATTWATISPPQQLATGTNLGTPLLASYLTYIVMVVPRNTGNTIEAYYINTSNAATLFAGWQPLGTVSATNAAGSNALAVQSLDDRIAIVFANNTGGTNRLTIATFNISGGLQLQTINTSSANPQSIDIAGSSADTLWATWNEGALAQKLIGVTPTSLSTTLATTATIITLIFGGGVVSLAPSSVAGKGRMIANDSGTIIARSFQTTAGAAATDGAATTIQNALMIGRPFQYGTRYFVPACEAASDQKNCILCDFTDVVTSMRPVALVAPNLAVQSVFFKGKSFVGAQSTRRYFGLGITRSSVANACALAEYDFANTKRWQPASFGNSLFLSGGILSYSDGVRVAEVSFLIRPHTLAVSVTGGPGITGTFRYVAAYEEVDADGNWHVSGVSLPSAPAVAANQTVTVTTGPLTISARINTASAQSSSVRLAIYRTLTGGASPYYRLATVINDTTLANLTYVDSTTDVTLAANAKLYSQPGVVGTAQDRRPPPGLSSVVSYSGMLCGAYGSDIWFSGQNVSGEGAWFNPLFQVPVAGDGPITGLAVMDGALFAFKRTECHVIAGDAPTDNGSAGGLGIPRRLATDVGCIDSRSTCTSALGVFFQSERGIEMLTRAQTVQWIGQPIQKTLAAFPVVTDANVVPTPSGAVVYIELAASEANGQVGGNGRTLVYDLALNAWISTDLRTSVLGAVAAPVQSGCMIYTGTVYRYGWIDTSGNVHYEDRTTNLDANSSFVVPLLETAWYNAFQNEQRVWRASLLFQRYNAAGLKVEVATNWGPYVAIPAPWIWTETDTKGQRQLEGSPDPRAESMKFRITATAPVTPGTGQGIGIFAVVLDLAEKQGPTKGTIRLDPALRR